ncbi:MAG: hypothetical protein DRI72_01250 [Bacteroidetes bacterium]|nr:MAG: hypothetical protein DRI72_01250 [Bacteroidota bacterium]
MRNSKKDIIILLQRVIGVRRILVFIALVPLVLNGQVMEPCFPASLNDHKLTPLPFIVLEENNVTSKKDFVKQALPLPAGHTIPLEENIPMQGIWDTIDETFVWRIGFYVPGASALNIYLSNMNLREGDKLFIYTTKDQPEGAYTYINNDVLFAVGFLRGDSLLVELNTSYHTLPFRLTEVGVADRMAGLAGRDFGGAGGCEVPVNCEEGDSWQSEKNGVARVLVKEATNLFWCTGSLINNTNNDGKPYFLTANHCGEYASALDYRAWIFYFNYESEDCELPLTEPDNSHRINGASLLAHSRYDIDEAADFKLLLLNRDIPESYHAYYNGWDRSGAVSPSGVTIHHPQGDIKMISTYTDPIISTEYYGAEPIENGMYWKVEWAETKNGYGVTEGGSSGSPLFNPEGFIIGALTGGEASCSYPEQPDYYGKFSHAWESEGADSTRQLKYWLDPLHTGVKSLKGTNLDTTLALANFSSDVLEITIGEQVNYVNYSTGNITGYAWYFEGGEPSYSEAEDPPPVRYNTFGAFGVTLIAKSANGNDTLHRPGYIHVLPMMVPNPSAKGVYRLTFGKEIPSTIEINVFDLLGRIVGPVFVTENENSLYIDLSRHAAGLYLIHVKTDERLQILKAFYIKK